MKETVLDVLMYLFQNYMNELPDTNPDRDSMESDLVAAGFPVADVQRALDWLDGLEERRNMPRPNFLYQERTFRIYTDSETARLNLECRGFLLFLEQTGILSAETRELVLDRIMALDHDEIELDQLKWVILLVLFDHPGQEAAYAWMEDLLFEEASGFLH